MNQEEVPLKTLSADLLSLLANGQAFSDVTFAVEGRHVYAHRCVLAARSQFFRMIFCGDVSMQNTPQQRAASPLVIPVGIVGYDVFLLLLQFLYSGQLAIAHQQHMHGVAASACKEKACWHTHCPSAVDFALETLNAAQFFGVEQLSLLTQRHLAEMAEKASVEDVMRILVAARMQEGSQLWSVCSKLVAKSGLPSETLHKHLQPEVVAEIESIRHKVGYGMETRTHDPSEEQRILRMRKALEISDVELVRLMVMGEGLNLDKAYALHYAVSHCSRKVVQNLLELDAANVNALGPDGRAPLHVATEMADPEMIAVLLDHRADPGCRTSTGVRAVDLARSLASDALAVGAITGLKSDHSTKFRLCADLLEAAASMDVRKQEPVCITAVTTTSDNNVQTLMAMRPSIASNPSNATLLSAHPHETHFYPVIGHSKVLPEQYREPERGETSDPIARLLYPCTLDCLPSIHEDSLSSFSCVENPGSGSGSGSGSDEERARKRHRSRDSDLREMLKEVVLKDITNWSMLLNEYAEHVSIVEDEVNSLLSASAVGGSHHMNA